MEGEGLGIRNVQNSPPQKNTGFFSCVSSLPTMMAVVLAPGKSLKMVLVYLTDIIKLGETRFGCS